MAGGRLRTVADEVRYPEAAATGLWTEESRWKIMATSFEAFYKSGGAAQWERGKADVVRQVADLLMSLSATSRRR